MIIYLNGNIPDIKIDGINLKYSGCLGIVFEIFGNLSPTSINVSSILILPVRPPIIANGIVTKIHMKKMNNIELKGKAAVLCCIQAKLFNTKEIINKGTYFKKKSFFNE